MFLPFFTYGSLIGPTLCAYSRPRYQPVPRIKRPLISKMLTNLHLCAPISCIEEQFLQQATRGRRSVCTGSRSEPLWRSLGFVSEARDGYTPFSSKPEHSAILLLIAVQINQSIVIDTSA